MKSILKLLLSIGLLLSALAAQAGPDVVRLGNLKFAHYGAVSYMKEIAPRYNLKVEERVFAKGLDIIPGILDPLLILLVVAIESRLNPFAESAMGAQGLMQVMTRDHAGRFEPHGGQIAALDPIATMKVGSAILADMIMRGGSVERGLQLYVGAGNLPDDGGYGARVLGERARLTLARHRQGRRGDRRGTRGGHRTGA